MKDWLEYAVIHLLGIGIGTYAALEVVKKLMNA